MDDELPMDQEAGPRAQVDGNNRTIPDTVLSSLQDSERRFRASMEHSPIGMALTKLDGTWIDVNPALCNFLGYSKQELMEAGFKSVTHAEDREATVLMARKMVATHQKSVTLEKRYIHADGSIVTGVLSLTVVRDQDDSPTMFISQIVDVTAARRLDYLKSEFITTVNHELRTPLTGVMGALSLLEKFLSESASDRDRQLVAVAAKNAARLKSLLDDILEMDSMNAQGYTPLIEEVDLVATVRKVLDVVQVKATTAAILLRDSLPDRPLIHATDPEKLGRALRILISNAIKYSDPGGEVEVEIVSIPDAIRLSVTNGGRPIPEAMRPFLFQAFVQGEDTGTRRKQGSGLGLSIAKHLVERLGGGIDYSSTEKATKFWIDLPVSARN